MSVLLVGPVPILSLLELLLLALGVRVRQMRVLTQARVQGGLLGREGFRVRTFGEGFEFVFDVSGG
jgi:hypothetical protein